MSLHSVIIPSAVVLMPRGPSQRPLALPLILTPIASVVCAISETITGRKVHRAVAISFVFLPFSLVPGPVGKHHEPAATSLALSPFAIISATVLPGELARAVHFVIEPLSAVMRAIGPLHLPLTLSHIVFPFSNVPASINTHHFSKAIS